MATGTVALIHVFAEAVAASSDMLLMSVCVFIVDFGYKIICIWKAVLACGKRIYIPR